MGRWTQSQRSFREVSEWGFVKLGIYYHSETLDMITIESSNKYTITVIISITGTEVYSFIARNYFIRNFKYLGTV